MFPSCVHKVVDKEITLKEMNQAAKEMKLLKPVQDAITSYFNVNSWEEVIEKCGRSVSAESLMKFAVLAPVSIVLRGMSEYTANICL